MRERTTSRKCRDRVWTPFVGAMLLASCLAPPQRGDDFQSIRTRRLSIVNDEGKTVVEIFGDEQGGALSLRSADGQELVTLRIDHLGGSLLLAQNDGRPAIRMNTGPITATTTAGTVDVFDSEGETAVVLSSGAELGVSVSMGAGVRGGVLGLFRDGGQHLLDPLALDRMKAAHPDDGE